MKIWAITLALTLSSLAPFAAAQQTAARSESVTGQTLIYEKSNLDGSNRGLIAVHYAADDRIESFKWHPGSDHATKVRAHIDLQTLTVSRFEGISVGPDGLETLRAELVALPGGSFQVRLGDNEETVSLPPANWHSYDFDFASLGFAWRFLAGNRERVEFRIYDLDLRSDPVRFRDFGEVRMTLVGEDTYTDLPSLKYRLDGPGLDHRGGHIWFATDSQNLAGFELQKPDEPGYESGKLSLLETRWLSASSWAEFQVDALSGAE